MQCGSRYLFGLLFCLSGVQALLVISFARNFQLVNVKIIHYGSERWGCNLGQHLIPVPVKNVRGPNVFFVPRHWLEMQRLSNAALEIITVIVTDLQSGISEHYLYTCMCMCDDRYASED